LKHFVVNPLLALFYLSLALIISSCGFQLNRNQVSLPNGAQALTILSIENKSFTPNLDILLSDRLSEFFNRANIPLQSPSRADLALKVIVTQADVQRNEITLDTEILYEYQSYLQVKIWVRDLRNNKELTSGNVVAGKYIRETTETSLTDFDLQEDLELALDNLTQNIGKKLTQNF